MKKILIAGIVLVFIATFATVTWGLSTPELTEKHGEVTASHVNDIGLVAEGQYAFAPRIGAIAEIGKNGDKRAGLKYELNPNLALEGGIMDTGSQNVFVGINGSASISKTFQGLWQIDLSIIDNNLYTIGEFGAKYTLNRKFDIRGGIYLTLDDDDNTTNLELGLGYRF